MKNIFSPRAVLIIIAAMFLLPLLLAWFMYNGTIDFKPASTRNLGTLVEPPLPMSWADTLLISETGEKATSASEHSTSTGWSSLPYHLLALIPALSKSPR